MTALRVFFILAQESADTFSGRSCAVSAYDRFYNFSLRCLGRPFTMTGADSP